MDEATTAEYRLTIKAKVTVTDPTKLALNAVRMDETGTLVDGSFVSTGVQMRNLDTRRQVIQLIFDAMVDIGNPDNGVTISTQITYDN